MSKWLVVYRTPNGKIHKVKVEAETQFAAHQQADAQVGPTIARYALYTMPATAQDSKFIVDTDLKSGQRQVSEFPTKAEAVAYAGRMAMDSGVSWSSVRNLAQDGYRTFK